MIVAGRCDRDRQFPPSFLDMCTTMSLCFDTSQRVSLGGANERGLRARRSSGTLARRFPLQLEGGEKSDCPFLMPEHCR